MKNKEKIQIIKEKINGTGYLVDKLKEDVENVQKRLAKLMEELELLLKE